MTQNASDVEIANQGFAAFRQDLNDVLEDITTLHSGTAAPSTTYANQWWYETDTDKLYIRNEDNDAWIEILTLDQANDHLASLGASITLDSAGAVTLQYNGSAKLATTSTGVDVTGTVTADGLTVDTNTLYVDSTNNRVGIGTTSPDSLVHLAANTGAKITIESTDVAITANEIIGEIDFYSNDASGIGAASRGSISLIAENAAGAGSMLFKTSDASTAASERLRILSGGGITFNGDTAAANALDDYEEGTWTPTLEYTSVGATQPTTSVTSNFTYIKVGTMVFISGYMSISNAGSGSGTRISGLPYAANASFLMAPFWTAHATSPIGGYISSGVQFIQLGLLEGASNGVTSSNLPDEISVQHVYRTS